MLPSNPETNTTVKSTRIFYLIALIVLCNSLLMAADRGTIIREAVIYLSPDTNSNKLGQVERGRELILLDKSPKWLHVEALLGSSHPADPAFVFDDEEEGKTIFSGWVLDTGVVWGVNAWGRPHFCSVRPSILKMRRAAAMDAVERRRMHCVSIAVSTIFSQLLRSPAKRSIVPLTSDGRSKSLTCSPGRPPAKETPIFASAWTRSR